MTERGSRALERSADHLRIGPSALSWDGTALTLEIDEVTVPWPSRCRGRVRVQPPGWLGGEFQLHPNGRHRWRPLAPAAEVEVELDEPGLRWRGRGYVDHNHGDEPLEAAFDSWNWSRAHLRRGCSAVLYDVRRRGVPGQDGQADERDADSLALRFDQHGDVEPFERPPIAALPSTGWRMPRSTRADGGQAEVLRTLEDAPFYSRSLLTNRLLGEPVTAVHESLSLKRFANPVVQAMLPFRMPRRGG